MSEEFYDDIDLCLNIKEFEELKKAAQKNANTQYSGEDPNKYYLFGDWNFDVTSEEYVGGEIHIGGNIVEPKTKKELGYVSFNINMNLERVDEIVQFYMKKLGKVKTIMEAVKSE